MSEKYFQKSLGNKESIQTSLEEHGVSDPSMWREATDLSDREEKTGESFNEKRFYPEDFNKILTYLDSGLRTVDRLKIERFSQLTGSIDRLTALQSMSVQESCEAIFNSGLNEGAWAYLSRRLDFFQRYVAGEATRKVNVQEWDEKKQQYIDVVKEEIIDASYIEPENIKTGLRRDIYYAAMQGTPEMGATKIATRWINDEVQKNPDGTQNVKSRVRNVVQFHGYYSGIFEGSLGLYSELHQLYEECKKVIIRRSSNANIDEKEVEHRSVRLTARRLEGAFNYAGTLDTSASPYSAGFKESVIVGQLGHKVMRQMRGMRGKIQETNFRNVERFIGKSGDNRYQGEKKRLDKDIKALEDFIQDNNSYDASSLTIKQDGIERQVKGKEAGELMTKQKNSEATQRAHLWFERESEKINHWLEKSKTKIAGYDIPEEERDAIYSSVQDRYNKKISDLQQEYHGEIDRLENRTPEVLLGAFKERQAIVNKRFEKRKSLAQKALDLHFRFNHIGNQRSQEERNQEREHELNERIKNLETEYTAILSHVEYLTTSLERDYPEFKECIFSNEADLVGQDNLSAAYHNYNNKLLGNLHTEYQDIRDRIELQQKTRAHNFEQSGVEVDNNLLSKDLQDKLEIWYTKKVSELDNDTQNGLKEFLLRRDTLFEAIDNSKIKNERILTLKKVPLGFGQNTVFSGLIDWVNDAPFGLIKRTHRALSAGTDDQTVMMRALAEVNGESPNDQNPQTFIMNIIKSGSTHQVIQNFEKFSGITDDQHLNILLAIIGSGAGGDAVESLDKFTGITANDHLQIVQALNASNAGETVVTNLEKFNGVKPEDKRNILFAAIKGGGGYQVAQNFEKFSDVFSPKDHLEIAHELSKAGAGGAVIDNFQKFSGIPVEEHRPIVLEAIKGGGSYQVIQNLEKFSGITEKDHRDIVLEIIKSGGGGYYLNNALDKFKGLEEGLRQVIKAGKYEALPHVLEAGFTIEEITRFPFLISPLVTKK